jgi:hypothetical protein
MLQPNLSLLLVLILTACSGDGRLSPFLQAFDNQTTLDCRFDLVWDASLQYVQSLSEPDDPPNAYVFADRVAGLITYSVEERGSSRPSLFGGVRDFTNHTILMKSMGEGTKVFYHIKKYAPYHPVGHGVENLLMFESPTPHLQAIASKLEEQKACE